METGLHSGLESSDSNEFHKLVYGDLKGFAERINSIVQCYIPGIIKPHGKLMPRWKKLYVLSCLFAIFLDPLFFFLMRTREDHKCIGLNWPMTKAFVALRSLSDFIHFLHILLQFRLAYISPDSVVVGTGTLVEDPQKIAHWYMSGYFIFDLFVVLPLPQITIFLYSNATIEDYAKNLLVTCIIFQSIPRLCRSFPLLVGHSLTGFIFESAWSIFIVNLLMFLLAGHAVGSCWYLLTLQRVNQCLRDACQDSNISRCVDFLDCGHGQISEFIKDLTWNDWTNNTNAISCFKHDDIFPYGIYRSGVNLTTKQSIITRYVYSLFWGFQQISTFAGNQEPSYFEGEVFFIMMITVMGLILFAVLIGNMQNFLSVVMNLSIHGKLEMMLRRRDVERWMRHRCFPDDLQRRIQYAEHSRWAATQGVNEEMLMENLPDDLQRDVRRHLFKSVKSVKLFNRLDDSIVDVICGRLRTMTFMHGDKIFIPGGLINKMVFIIHGELESIEDNQNAVQLTEGDVCGEELLIWYLDHRTSKEGRCLSSRLVKCLTNVETYVLRAADLEEIASLFSRRAIRYGSTYWRSSATRTTRVAWRYHKKRMNRRHQRSRINDLIV